MVTLVDGAAPWSPGGSANWAPAARWLGAIRLCPFWPSLLLLTLIWPTELSFAIGSLRLTAYRVVLLLALAPALKRLLSGEAGRLGMVDILVLCHLSWACLVIAYHHGASVAVESGGLRLVELGGGYLVARGFITGERAFRGFVAMIGFTLCVIAPFVLYESLTGASLIKHAAAQLQGGYFRSEMTPRMGLYRAYGPFDHPILLGVYAASALALLTLAALPRLGRPRARRLALGAAIAGALASISAGALAALAIQSGLLAWERATRDLRQRWWLLGGLCGLVYAVVDLLSNRSPLHVFLHYLTFSAHTAYYRTIVFDWGMEEVWRHPLLGIGFNEWRRPDWMYSASIDNFWLMQAMSFGTPGFLSLAAATLLALAPRGAPLPPRLRMLRYGWIISMLGFVVAGLTVHFWNSLFVHFALLLGAGIWFHQIGARRAATEAIQ